MTLMVTIVKVVFGWLVLFSIARVTHTRLVRTAGWSWVVVVFVLGTLNMLLHRWVGSEIDAPFYTGVWFAVGVSGLPEPWGKRGAYGAIAGTILGWLSYAEIASK